MIQSLDRALIEEIARVDPYRPTAFVVALQIGDLPPTGTGAVVVEDWSYDDCMLRAAHDQGRQVYIWTVNDVGAIRHYLGRGVDGIITDEVARATSARERLRSGPVGSYLERAIGLIAGEARRGPRLPTGSIGEAQV